jgi:hypothetical protein
VQEGSPVPDDPSGGRQPAASPHSNPEQNWEQVLKHAGWYNSEKLAAYVFLDRLNPKSIEDDLEYSTLIVRRGNKYAFLGVVTGEQNTSPGIESYLQSFYKSGPTDTHVTAWAHTHSRWGELSRFFGPGDAQFGNDYGLNGYLGTPQGHFDLLRPGGPNGIVPGENLGELPPNRLYDVPP